MGRSVFDRDAGTHQRPHEVHCRTYEKPAGDDRALYASTVSGQHDCTFLADHTRVSIRTYRVTDMDQLNISRSAHSASPAYTYAEYGSMTSPMTTMPPPPFMPIMSDRMIHSMHSFPPSPLTHCSVYDAPSWNMMPMYPVSPIQPLYDAGDCYAGYHQRKAQPSGTEPSTPSDSSQRAIYTKNLSSFSTPAGREHSLQSAVTIEQGRMTDPRDNQFQTHSSAMTSSIEENKQAAPVLDNTTFTSSSSRYSDNPDQRPSMNMTRSGSWEWDGAMASSHEDPEARVPVTGDDRDGCSGLGQAVQGEKIAGSSQPLVVDGSGLRKRSLELELMSASAPS